MDHDIVGTRRLVSSTHVMFYVHGWSVVMGGEVWRLSSWAEVMPQHLGRPGRLGIVVYWTMKEDSGGKGTVVREYGRSWELQEMIGLGRR